MKPKKQNQTTDEQLIKQFQQGDQLAMGELYSRYYMLVFAKSLSFVKNTDDAADLAQDIMLRVMEKAGTFKQESKFSTWLYAITFNYCTDRVRKNKNRYYEYMDVLDSHIDHSTEDQDLVFENETKEKVAEEALMAISREDHELLLMKYQLNKSIHELQSIYNLSASAVKMRLMRAREKAATIYNAYSLGAA
ncbi:MAG: RNA polymerase sigma factor [Cyclobacteriaceae bacterium]